MARRHPPGPRLERQLEPAVILEVEGGSDEVQAPEALEPIPVAVDDRPVVLLPRRVKQADPDAAPGLDALPEDRLQLLLQRRPGKAPGPETRDHDATGAEIPCVWPIRHRPRGEHSGRGARPEPLSPLPVVQDDRGVRRRRPGGVERAGERHELPQGELGTALLPAHLVHPHEEAPLLLALLRLTPPPLGAQVCRGAGGARRSGGVNVVVIAIVILSCIIIASRPD